MTNPIDDIRRQAEAAARAENPRDHLQRLQEQADRLAASANELRDDGYESQDETDAVRCTVDGSGRVTALKITARGMQQNDHESLSEAVVAAYRAAMVSMAASVKDELQARFGVTLDDNAAQKIDLDEIFTKGSRTEKR